MRHGINMVWALLTGARRLAKALRFYPYPRLMVDVCRCDRRGQP